MIVARTIEIDAAHYLPGYKGKCANLHGHRWKIEIAVRGKLGQKSGMVLDFSDLNVPLETVKEHLDHTCINEVIQMPTAENIVNYVMRIFLQWFEDYAVTHAPANFRLVWVRVWETEDSYAMLEAP